jgi:hypothetical protein
MYARCEVQTGRGRDPTATWPISDLIAAFSIVWPPVCHQQQQRYRTVVDLGLPPKPIGQELRPQDLLVPQRPLQRRLHHRVSSQSHHVE